MESIASRRKVLKADRWDEWEKLENGSKEGHTRAPAAKAVRRRCGLIDLRRPKA